MRGRNQHAPGVTQAEEPGEAGPPSSRRSFVAGAAGGLAALVARGLTRTPSAAAANGDPIIIGQVNTGTVPTSLLNQGAGHAFSAVSGPFEGHIGAAGAGAGVFGYGAGSTFGVMGATQTGVATYGATGQAGSGPGVRGENITGLSTGVQGTSGVNLGAGPAPAVTGVHGYCVQGSGARGVAGETTAGTGVEGLATSGMGVRGASSTGIGVRGTSSSTNGVSGASSSGDAVRGSSGGAGKAGVLGENRRGGYGVRGTTTGAITTAGVLGENGGAGPGVRGNGSGGDGVLGTTNTGNGVHATATGASGTALFVEGVSRFTRSGIVTVPAGQDTVGVSGVALFSTSIVLALLQDAQPDMWVMAAIPDIATSSIKVVLSKPAPASMPLGWFVVN